MPPSHDPELPLLISYPRSGSNWLQAAMELYFDRHRAGKVPASPSWLETPYENPMWDFQHDLYGQIVQTELPVIFLWRNPVDAIHSRVELLKYTDKGTIKRFAREYRLLFEKWYSPANREVHGGGDVLIVRYETVLKQPHNEMRRISKFWGVPYNSRRSKKAFKMVGDKKSVNERNGPDPEFKNPDSWKPEYERRKRQFRKDWEKFIVDLVNFPENLALYPNEGK